MDIPIGEEHQRLEIPVLRGFFSVFMSVGVLSKLKEEMCGEIDQLAGNHGLQAKRSKDAILGGEAVASERHGINDIIHEDT